MKKVLVITYYFPPLGMGGVQWPLKICKYLPYYGYEPIVLTVKDISYYTYDYSLMKEVNCKVIRTESFDPLRLKKLLGKEINFSKTKERWKSVSDFLFIPDNKIMWLPFAISRTINPLANGRDIDIIFAISPPYTSLLIGALLRRMLHIPLVIDFREAWTEAHFMHYPTKVHYLINRFIEAKVIKSANKITCVNERIVDSLKKRHKREMEIIPTGYDSEDFKNKEELKEKFTITYTGAFTEQRSPEFFLTAVKRLIDSGKIKKEEIEVNLIGFSLYSYKKFGIPGVVNFIPYLSHKESLKALKSSTVLWLLVDEREDKFMTTGKVYEYLATGRPILATIPEGDCADLIRATKSGIIVPPKNIKRIAESVCNLYRNFKNKELVENHQLFLSEFDHKNLSQHISQIFTEVLR